MSGALSLLTNAVIAYNTRMLDEVIAANLRGAFLCARAAVKLMMKQRSGHILLIGSRSGRRGNRGQSAYAERGQEQHDDEHFQFRLRAHAGS